MKRLAIMAALPQELGDLIAHMRGAGDVRTVTLGKREYHVGEAHGVPVVVTLARIGKVAAAATASALIHVFGVDAILFTGVAGGVRADVRVGDIVVANALLQHDLDASPFSRATKCRYSSARISTPTARCRTRSLLRRSRSSKPKATRSPNASPSCGRACIAGWW